VALALDHVSLVDCPTVIGFGEAEIVTVGAAGGGLPSLPPPPQASRRLRPNSVTTRTCLRLMGPPGRCGRAGRGIARCGDSVFCLFHRLRVGRRESAPLFCERNPIALGLRLERPGSAMCDFGARLVLHRGAKRAGQPFFGLDRSTWGCPIRERITRSS
jgi:hypothetical protein